MMKRIISILALLALAISPPALAKQGSSSACTPLPDDEAARSNIELALEHISGLYLPYGAQFSFNETVGPRTSAYGYQSALNGRGAKVTGGGAGQVATTLYLALNVLDGIEYTELRTYGESFTGGYAVDGSDVVLVDYSSGIDFVFDNFAGDMDIEMWTSDDYLYCSVSIADAGEADLSLSWAADAGELSPTFIASAEIPLEGTPALINNVTLAADSINDTVLEPGDLFSFNEIVGPRNERYGYQGALNGRGVKVTGGGVAQVASALWLAVKNLDSVAIVQKSTYGSRYNQDYVASSNDAILTDYSNGTDFSFRNIGDEAITISTWVSEDTLYCVIYS